MPNLARALLPFGLLLVACGAPGTLPGAAPPVGTPALFARYKQASGGAAWDAVALVQSEGTLSTGGLSGSITLLEDARTGRTLSRFTLGSMHGAEGFDGAHAWEQDPGGEVTTHDAPESLETARTDRWLTTRSFFRPDLGQAEVTPPRDETLDGARYLVVEATPPGGRKVALWFDAQTALLARTVMRRDAKTITTVLADYRPERGVKVPFHATQDATDASGRTDPREHADIALARVVVNPPAPADAFAMPAMTPAARIDDPSGVTRVPFQLVNNHIYVDGSIDGKPVHVLVDTGGANLLTPDAARRLGISGEGKLAAGGVGDQQVDVALGHASEVRLGAAVLAHPVFYILDMGPMAAIEGTASDGLVGFEMFRRFRVTIDYAGRVLELAEPAHFTPPAGAHVVPFDLAERIPVLTGKLDGLPVRVSVDTGSRASLTLHAPFVREHDLVKRYDAAPETITGWGVGGPARGRPARLRALELGDLTVRDIAGDLFVGAKGAFANPDLSANLGGGVLRRFTVAFDYDARKMYLAPNADHDRPDPFDRSGCWLLARGEALEVAGVTPGGPAERAGLKVGDRVVSLGGEPARGRTVAEWRARLREQPAGTRVPLRVLSAADGARERPVDLVLADAIPEHARP